MDDTSGEAVMRPAGLSERTVAAGQEVLAGRRRGLLDFLPFAGPAVVASIAYIDPGNFATNIQAGSHYGYALLWVVVAANAIAMLFQGLSAKLGIVTGRSLASLCRLHLPGPLVVAMWLASEVAAMATDLAEFLGGAIGLALLFHLPLLAALGITALVTYGLLLLGHRGFRPIELVIGGFIAVIGLGFAVEVLIAHLDWAAFARGAVVPDLPDGGALTLAVGIIGATVMPHAIYLHSALTQNRMPTAGLAQRRRLLGFSNREVVLALSFAGVVNMAMVGMAAAVFHAGHADVAEIETAYHLLVPLLGGGAGIAFMAALLASGFSSSVVGTMAGQSIMQDFLRWRTPLWLRRAITMLPAFAVVALGWNATQSLMISQVVLSLALPVPMLALLWFTGRRAVMGAFVNSRLTQAVAVAAALVVMALNAVLLAQLAGVAIPGLG
ncbi:MAG: Nramp family divalent metal transporter [Rhodospirillales bacterium]|nr:Nramp family divalent metal transporter [Rhodospirillales bacterium]